MFTEATSLIIPNGLKGAATLFQLPLLQTTLERTGRLMAKTRMDTEFCIDIVILNQYNFAKSIFELSMY